MKKYIYQTAPIVVWEIFKKNPLLSSKTNSSIFMYLTQLELQKGTGSMVRQKKNFMAANPQDWFGAHRNKKYPMCTIKYAAGSLMFWAYFSAGCPGHLIHMAS